VPLRRLRRSTTMIRVKATTIVERRPEDIWAYVSNLDNLKEWDPGVVGRRERMAEISNIKRILESDAPTDTSPR
jgi:ligand-binding SRPBCC domain-containing protein